MNLIPCYTRYMDQLIVIIAHQMLFQGMFALKNYFLKRRLKMQIRGQNKEANISTAFFVLFISLSSILAGWDVSVGRIPLMNPTATFLLSLMLLILSLLISAFSLSHLKDSWRVGVIDEQETKLITSGIYRFTRNPYFVSYLLMFMGYSILLQNVLLIILSVIGFGLVHWMVRKEERYLLSIHGDMYRQYQQSTRRYL